LVFLFSNTRFSANFLGLGRPCNDLHGATAAVANRSLGASKSSLFVGLNQRLNTRSSHPLLSQ
jgi:hypothetical protein